MTRTGVQLQSVNALEFADLPQGLRGERSLAVKSVQDDALDQVAERHVLVRGERLQHLQDAPLHAHPGLDAFDFESFGRSGHGVGLASWYQYTMVPEAGANRASTPWVGKLSGTICHGRLAARTRVAFV